MKKLLMVPVFGALLALAGCGGVDVVDYNDKLVDFTEDCFTAEGLVWDALDDENYGLVNELLDTSISTCQSAKESADAMEAYKDDSSLRDSVSTLLDAEIQYLVTFKDYIVYWDLDELTAEQEAEYDALDAQLDEIDETIVAASESLIAIQEAFATKHGYELED